MVPLYHSQPIAGGLSRSITLLDNVFLQLFSWQAIFCAGYKAVLHIHAVVEECEIVDPKIKKPMKKKPLFVKKGALVVCRVQVLYT